MRIPAYIRILIVLALFGVPTWVCAQDAPSEKPARIGFPWDWSHQHVVFTNTRDPKVLEKIRQDPRLFHHWLLRNLPQLQRNFAESGDPRPFAMKSRGGNGGGRPQPKKKAAMQPDWNTDLAGNTGFVKATTFPAKYSFNVNAAPDCVNDYVVFPTGVNGSATTASILAFNELYSTQGSSGGNCAQNGPSVAWAYINAACPATSSTNTIVGSPVLSLDGTKVAWVTTTGIVQVLTIGTTGNNGAAATAGAGSPPAPVCMGSPTNNAVLSSVSLSHAVSNSSLFVDYANDIAYVGDDKNSMHKLTPFFNGTPAEVTTGNWPLIVMHGPHKILTGPVYDSVSNNVFIGDDGANLYYVRLATTSAGTCGSGTPPCVGSTILSISSVIGLTDPPVVDSSNGWVYTQTSDANGTNAQIVQASTALTNVTTANVGGVSSTNDLHSGTFDNTYFNSGPTNSGARYYVCGLDSTGSDSVVYQFGFNTTTGALNTSPTTSLAVTGANNTPCSPLTENYNANASGGAKDWLFLSVLDHGAGTACNNKPCVLQIDITNAPTTLSIGQAAIYSPNAGTSGIIIDNVSTLSETSNLYFATLGARVCTTGGNGGCATKLHQSNLQ